MVSKRLQCIAPVYDNSKTKNQAFECAAVGKDIIFVPSQIQCSL